MTTPSARRHTPTSQGKPVGRTTSTPAAGLRPPRPRGPSRRALIADLQRVAASLKSPVLLQTQYMNAKSARFSYNLIRETFGSWFAALSAAGLRSHYHFPFNSHRPGPQVTRDQLLADLRRVARAAHATTLTKQDYRRLGGQYETTLLAARCGSWNTALAAVGLAPTCNRNIPEQLLLEDLRHAAAKLHADSLSANDYKRLGHFGQPTLQHRFGTWNRALQAAGLQLQRVNTMKCRSLPEGTKRAGTPTQILADLQRVARALEVPTLSPDQYLNAGGTFDPALVKKLFQRRWNSALLEAGLLPFRPNPLPAAQHPLCFRRADPARMLADLAHILRKLDGARMSKSDYRRRGGIFPISTLLRTFGTWPQVVNAAATRLPLPAHPIPNIRVH